MKNNFIIWDREQELKGLDKEVWFEAYPEAKTKTLVLIDESLVVWLEDIKADGFTGETDEDVVKAYILKQKEIAENTPPPEPEKTQEELIKEAVDKATAELKKSHDEEINKISLQFAEAVAEITSQIEANDLKASEAIAEVSEYISGMTE